MRKTIRLLAMSMVYILVLSSTVSAGECYPEKLIYEKIGVYELDTIDVAIMAGYYLRSISEKAENISLDSITPLYSPNGEIVAYYVTVFPSGYAIINNNKKNPTVIEFGTGTNPVINDIISQSKDAHIVYNNPVDIYDVNSKNLKRINNSQVNIYSYYPDLLQDNLLLSNICKEIKKNVVTYKSNGGGYGFINIEDMPGGVYIADTIESAKSTDWVIMDEFNDIAENHCGATAVTNLAMYFTERGYSNLRINNHRDTFSAVYEIVGKGPKFTIADESEKYFKQRGYTLNHRNVGTFDEIRNAVSNERPCGILLADSMSSWHWVICVGYRKYSDVDCYMRIMDGWYNTIDRYYKINTGALWIGGSEYWI